MMMENTTKNNNNDNGNDNVVYQIMTFRQQLCVIAIFAFANNLLWNFTI